VKRASLGLAIFIAMIGIETLGEAQSVGISGDRFTVDGRETFLLGVSYFDVLGWKASDLDDLSDRQFNLIRIWLDWGVWTDRSRSFFNADGSMKNIRTLVDFVRACAARGIIVDVTVLSSNAFGARGAGTAEVAIRNAVRLLRDEPNVIFDLMNEHNWGVRPWSASHRAMRRLVAAAREEAPSAIIFYSNANEFRTDRGLLSHMVDAELDSGVSLLAPHSSRPMNWYGLVARKVAIVKNYLGSIDRNVPVYMQEESRNGNADGDFFTADQLTQAVREARDSGAAGYVFHTAAGFDLAGSRTFFGNLDSEEWAALNQIAREIVGEPRHSSAAQFVSDDVP
jgi:Cellulase (glycosyl hydrolase family 5)